MSGVDIERGGRRLIPSGRIIRSSDRRKSDWHLIPLMHIQYMFVIGPREEHSTSIKRFQKKVQESDARTISYVR